MRDMSEWIMESRDASGHIPMPEVKEPRKPLPCHDCREENGRVWFVNGRRYCGDCLAIRAKAFDEMLRDFEGYYYNWRIK